jgi:hypothetical protein
MSFMRLGFTVMMLNQTTTLTLEEPCFASPQESMTGTLASESSAALFFSIIKALCIMNSRLNVRQLIKIFIWQF